MAGMTMGGFMLSAPAGGVTAPILLIGGIAAAAIFSLTVVFGVIGECIADDRQKFLLKSALPFVGVAGGSLAATTAVALGVISGSAAGAPLFFALLGSMITIAIDSATKNFR